MLIKKAAQATGLTERAIRFYEEAGLIAPRLNASRFRDYREEDLERLRQIAALRGLGLSLDEITVFLTQPEQARDLLETVRRRLQAKADRAQQGEAALARALQAAPAAQDSSDWMRLLAVPGNRPKPPQAGSAKKRYTGGIPMRESKMSSIIWIAGLLAVIAGVILAFAGLLIAYHNNQPFPLGNALLNLIVTIIPGLAAMALAEVLENQAALQLQNQRLQLSLLDMADGASDEVVAETPPTQTWKCAACNGLNASDALYCRHCQALRDFRARS
ncbi:MAG: MerR family transcriptional regulator [Clostridiaceae bacterium]|jgi:DNA-binding transcriptional MerR regulator|nr:MerR family transcriptional regulator [Clostridiaceae bacterium]